MISTFRTVFSRPIYIVISIIATILAFLLPLIIPLWLIPSNTLSLEWSLMSRGSLALLIALALVTGLFAGISAFVAHQRKAYAAVAGGYSIGAFIAMVGGTISATCGCGMGILLGAIGIGAGSSSFIVDNQSYVTAGSLVIMLIALYLTIRSAAGACSIK